MCVCVSQTVKTSKKKIKNPVENLYSNKCVLHNYQTHKIVRKLRADDLIFVNAPEVNFNREN